MQRLRLRWTALLVLALPALALSGEVTRGAPDFRPTSEHPVFFRTDNACHPGATPPLEWWEGTPIQREVVTVDSHGKERKTTIWDASDTTSKNILWKSPLPGWSLAHPLVVGDRVFVVGHPHFVACYDANTGKQLWQREVLPLLLDGQPEARARAVQKALDLAHALFLVSAAWASVGRGKHSLFDGVAKDGTVTDPVRFQQERQDAAGPICPT